jgi:UDP-2-acetamido-3-amino-2,3-dideoxy-glucuronate N-acetyltransferase
VNAGPWQATEGGEMAARIHSTAQVAPGAELGEGVSVWQFAQVREGSKLGAGSIVGMGTYIDAGVIVGKNCKFQNHVATYLGLELEDGVFCGPCCVFTNDLFPRAINADGSLKGASDWTLTKTLVKYGAAIGANATIVCGTTIGRWALVGSGSVVTKDVPDFGLVRGNPARLAAFVSPRGKKMETVAPPVDGAATVTMRCPESGDTYEVDAAAWRSLFA